MNETLTKVCDNCKTEKDVSEFYKNKAGVLKLKLWCRDCIRVSNYWSEIYGRFREKSLVKSKQKYLRDPEKYKTRHKEYYKKNRKMVCAKEKDKYMNNETHRLKRGFGKTKKDTKLSITELYDYYNKQFALQNGCCAICGRHESEFEFRLSIDHDHKTKKLRGLLCCTCNSGLGMLQDDAELCLSAYNYLRKN